jgi:hypothetical protein
MKPPRLALVPMLDPETVPRSPPRGVRQAGKAYPVIAINMDAAGTDAAYGSEVDVDGGILRALATLTAASRTPRTLSCWCREAPGLDADNQYCMLLLIYVVGQRITGRVVADLCAAFDAVWPECARMEGHGVADGGEWPLAGLHDGQLVRYQ